MGTRELLILILGLAVVAVILRGLYVALHARRTQIRLAIDKNIPQDLDLEELEMSELPNGGARVVQRSLEAVNRQNIVQNELDLGTEPETEGAVPILLDTVEIKNQDELQEAEIADDPIDDEIDQLTDAAETLEEETVLYEDEIFEDEPLEDESFADEPSEAVVEQSLLDDPDDYVEDDSSDYDVVDEARQEPELGFDESLDDEFDDFAMSAGERIGASEQSSPGVSRFRNKFSSASFKEDENKESLFSRFSKKSSINSADEVDSPEQDPLLDGYEQSYQAAEDEVISIDEESIDADPGVDQSREPQSVTPQESEKNGVADINQARESRRPASKETVTDSSQPLEPSEVLVVNVMSREGDLFRGPELLQVLITAGLKHGDMNIFHRHVDYDTERPAVFSVANILNPGTFDLDAMEGFTTRGISLFLAMPSVISNRDAFEDMLRTAQQVRAALDGELRDDHRSVMTAQTIEHYRQRIHDYELRKLKAAQARS